MPRSIAETTPSPNDDRAVILDDDGPFNPAFMLESVRSMFRTFPLDSDEPRAWSNRRMYAALLGLTALNPRDETEVMLGVQAMAAHQAGMAAWRVGMNLRRPFGDSTRHITAACAAARTFDSMLRALERRQAKPLAIPVGRPASRAWDGAPDPNQVIDDLAERCSAGETAESPPQTPLTPEEQAAMEARREKDRIDKENEGLDIANTEGILPGGGMILMDDPTPQQEAYMARRLGLAYKREYAENLAKGIKKLPKIRPIRTGDLIP
jgi:hypothetical protein